MAFRTNAAPYQRAKNSTLRIMLILLAALVVVWICGIIYSFEIQGVVNEYIDKFNSRKPKVPLENVNYGLRAILMVVIAVAVTAVCDVLTTIIKHKKDSKESLKNEILYDLVHNYSWISAIIFALCLPVYTSYYVVIVGSIFATVVVKNLFGGFGKNIFNPAIMARIFVGLCFATQMAVPEILVEAGNVGIDVATGATLTSAFSQTSGWLATSRDGFTSVMFGSVFADYGIKELLLGQYVGALGETFTVVIFVLGIALSVLKVINWRTPVFYLGTVALTSLVIALVLGLDSPFSYVLYHLSLGGLMFGAVFMLTDPVTGPTSPFGKSLIGVVAGLFTVVFRIKGGPEGVMYSIALCNLISPAIDYLTVGKSNSQLVKKCCVVFGTLVVAIGLCTGLSWSANAGKEVYAIHGMDKVEYTLLEKALPLQEGHHFEKADDYKVKTNKLSEYVVDKASNSKLDKVYYIVDEAGTVVATAYSVKASKQVDTGHGTPTVNAYGLVAINKNGTIYGVGALKAFNTGGYGMEADINNYANTQFTGKDSTSYLDVAVLTGATYSSGLIQELIGLAYEEYNK